MPRPKNENGEKIINRSKFLALLKANEAMSSAVAEERQAWGEKLRKAEEQEGLDRKAFALARPFKRMDSQKAEYLWRNFKIYVEEYLEIGRQADLGDLADAARDADAAAE